MQNSGIWLIGLFNTYFSGKIFVPPLKLTELLRLHVGLCTDQLIDQHRTQLAYLLGRVNHSVVCSCTHSDTSSIQPRPTVLRGW